MTEKDTRIHALGAKKLSSTGRAFYQPVVQNPIPVNKPPIIVNTIPQPQIRYIMVQHPQFDTLLKEFSALRSMYDELLVKFQQKNSQESLKAQIQEVIQSTHNIEAKMSRIVEESNNMAAQQEQKQNKPNLSSNLETQKARHQKQCLQIIETVNKATQKIQELQNKNLNLRKQIQSQKEWREALEKENKRLKLMYEKMQIEKQEQILNLKKEIQLIKEQNQQQKIQKEKQEKQKQKQKINASFTKQKIDNSHYLAESQANQEQFSGFSRLSINGDATRKSRVYE